MYHKFLWGAATSAYQFEGAWDTDGKGASVQDLKRDPLFQSASGHYFRFREDVELLKEMGINSYRFSISWTRIFPDGSGLPNERGVRFYEELIDCLLEEKIEPIVTIYHFDLPAALEADGGWSNRQTIDAYVEYSKCLFRLFGSKVTYWITMNEQNMITLASDAVIGKEKPLHQKFQETHHMFLAQAKVMAYYHQQGFPGVIGPAPNIAVIYPKRDRPEDVLAAQQFANIRNWMFLDVPTSGHYNHQALSILEKMHAAPVFEKGDLDVLKSGRCDYIAFNYYVSNTVEYWPKLPGSNDAFAGDQQRGAGIPGYFISVDNEHLERTDFGWEIDPIGFKTTLHEIFSRYNLPLLITENGIGSYDTLEDNKEVHDRYRIDFLEQHTKQILSAKEEGVNVFGFTAWSAFDLISTHEGYEKRYGFIYVDYKDGFKRYKKDSYHWYREFIKMSEVNQV